MSAAVALQASRWPCLFSYVGGTARTKDGVGVVVSGSEKVLHQANPWDALGYQAVEEFVVLFDQRAFGAAAKVAEEAKKRVGAANRKRELAVLEQLAHAFDAWERFDHRKSKSSLDEVAKGENDLRAALGSRRGEQVLATVGRLRDHLEALCTADPPSVHHVRDLLANAKRRMEEGRFDDAVARLYRAIEAVAQLALKERHGIASTAALPLERVPEELREQWASRAREGTVMVGLQEAYRLLEALGDPLGEKFRSAGLEGPTSPLGARNQSILAHGFTSISHRICAQLWSKALALAGIDESSLPAFPVLGDTRAQ
jgi:CRISPR-associated protein (TIGR02710 family)